MSLSKSFVLIEGDRRREMERLLLEFGYSFAVVPRSVPSFGAASKVLHQWHVSPTVVKKAVGYVRGWTALCDPERMIGGDPESCRKLARLARSRVLATVCDGTAGAFGFTHVRGAATRALLTSGGTVVADVGAPLAEEDGIQREHPCEDDVLRVMERVAFPYEALEEPGPWQVLTLEEGGALAAADSGEIARKRQWWRFW